MPKKSDIERDPLNVLQSVSKKLEKMKGTVKSACEDTSALRPKELLGLKASLSDLASMLDSTLENLGWGGEASAFRVEANSR